jgi:hypothetical protein
VEIIKFLNLVGDRSSRLGRIYLSMDRRRSLCSTAPSKAFSSRITIFSRRSNGALALGLANIMIERGWYDQEFVRTWSNGPLLVRSDANRLLKVNSIRRFSTRPAFAVS